MSRTQDISPDFVTADSPSDLRRLLLLKQYELGGEVKYLSINFDGTQWVAWFFNHVDKFQQEKIKPKKG